MGKQVQTYDQMLAALGPVVTTWWFPADEWEAFLARRCPQGGVRSWRSAIVYSAVWFAILAPVALTVTTRLPVLIVAWVALAVGAAATSVWLKRQGPSASAEERVAKMRRNPCVLIGQSGVCCGVEFTLWNSEKCFLQTVRLAHGNPGLMEIATGTGKVAAVFDGVMLVASILDLFSGGHASVPAASRTVTTLVPIPSDRRGEAQAIMAAWLAPASQTA